MGKQVILLLLIICATAKVSRTLAQEGRGQQSPSSRYAVDKARIAQRHVLYSARQHVLRFCIISGTSCSGSEGDWSPVRTVRSLQTEPGTPWHWDGTTIFAACLACVVILLRLTASAADLRAHSASDLTSVPSFRPSLLPIRSSFPFGSMCICSCPSLADMGDIGAHHVQLPCSTDV